MQRNIAKQGRFRKARAEHLKEAEELAKQHTTEPYGPTAISLLYGARVAQAWAVNIMVDETTELILTK